MALLGLLSACGAGDGETAAPSSLPLDATPTTEMEAAPASTTSTTAPVELELTAEMFESMLASEGGRSLLASSISNETSLTTEEAECLLDAIPVEVLLEAADAFLGPNSNATPGLFSASQVDAVAPILEACNIASDALTP